MTIVTTKMVREIRARIRTGEPARTIAADLGISASTVYRHGSDRNMARQRAEERRRFEKLRSDPVRYAARMVKIMAWQKRQRDALRTSVQT